MIKPENHDEQSFAKQQFGVQPSETKMLGLKWNEVEDTLIMTINFQGLTIPGLELVSAHMVINLVTNVSNALQGLPKPRIFGWLDSSVALHWIRGNGQYKQFVANRVAKIQLHPEIEWRYVPTHDNPANLASRGEPVTTPLWWTGPEWLQDHDHWQTNPITETSADSEAEAKIIKEVLCVAQVENAKTDGFDDLLERRDLRRILRTSARMLRFVRNCRSKQKQRSPMTNVSNSETVQHHITSEPKLPSTCRKMPKVCSNAGEESEESTRLLCLWMRRLRENWWSEYTSRHCMVALV